jgi:MurNAc alpha-1-phosphate uridylyltransferase
VDAIRLLEERWNEAEMDALLLVVPLSDAHCHGGVGDFRMDPLGRLTRRAEGKPAPFVYTGVQIVSRRLFEQAPDGAFSMNLLWNRAIGEGRVFGLVHEGLWFDVGTPPALARTEAILDTA